MKYKLNIKGGGIFSKYMNVVQNLNNINFEDSDEFYFHIDDIRTDYNMFDFIFEQSLTNEFLHLECVRTPQYTLDNKIEYSPNFGNYKKIIKSFKFKKHILDKVQSFKKKYQVSEETIGVHIRLTDMNIAHAKEYGQHTFDSYLQKLNSENKYFIASDNYESIEKLEDIFGDKVTYLPNLIRGKDEKEYTYTLQIENFRNPIFWEEAFIEMLLLSECGSLICNNSNLSNASIIHSDTIKKITRIYSK